MPILPIGCIIVEKAAIDLQHFVIFKSSDQGLMPQIICPPRSVGRGEGFSELSCLIGLRRK